MEPSLWLKRSPPQPGLENETSRSTGHRLTHWASGILLLDRIIVYYVMRKCTYGTNFSPPGPVRCNIFYYYRNDKSSVFETNSTQLSNPVYWAYSTNFNSTSSTNSKDSDQTLLQGTTLSDTVPIFLMDVLTLPFFIQLFLFIMNYWSLCNQICVKNNVN